MNCHERCALDQLTCAYAQDNINHTCVMDPLHYRQTPAGFGCNQTYLNQICGCLGVVVPTPVPTGAPTPAPATTPASTPAGPAGPSGPSGPAAPAGPSGTGCTT